MLIRQADALAVWGEAGPGFSSRPRFKQGCHAAQGRAGRYGSILGGKPREFRQRLPGAGPGRPGCPEDTGLGLQRDGFIQGAGRGHHEGGFSLESGEGAAAFAAETVGKTRRPGDLIHADPVAVSGEFQLPQGYRF